MEKYNTSNDINNFHIPDQLFDYIWVVDSNVVIDNYFQGPLNNGLGV